MNYGDLTEQHIEKKILQNLSGYPSVHDKLNPIRNRAFVGK
jgi:hypothetical protein